MSAGRRMKFSGVNEEEEINGLIFKLQALLPESSSRCNTTVPASETLKEICKYIRRLHLEVDGLSKKLSQLLASMDTGAGGVDANIIRILLHQ